MHSWNISNLLLVVLFCLTVPAYAWNEKETHNIITEIAAKNSVLSNSSGNYLGILGFSNGLSTELSWDSSPTIKVEKIQNWLNEGAKLEDLGEWYEIPLGVRYLNHFHNPLKDWSSAGLSDMASGESLLQWAQDGINQESKLGGDWSWQKIRNYFYTALTSTSDTARQEYFARTFRGMGQQMHLVQDMAVPAHVRNDSHAQDALGLPQSDNKELRLETWAKDRTDRISLYANSYAANPSAYYPTVSLNVPISGYVPITQLVDASTYNGSTPSTSLAQGLAEYTNANFASEYTVFTENKPLNDKQYFPYPRTTSTNLQDFINQSPSALPETVIAPDGIPDTSFWIKKTADDGEKIDHFVRPGYFTNELDPITQTDLYRRTFYLDEYCHNDYVQNLIPRAVGYSAALLDYFFRGTLNVNVTTAEDITFSSIKLTVSNNTPNEAMGTGDVSLVIRYKALTETGSESVKILNLPSTDYSYKVVKLQNVDMSGSRELTFDFSTNPLPMNYSDMTMQLVYKGKLGNEDGAVAVSQPKPIDGIYSDFEVSLPPSGVYAKTSDDSTEATFDELRVTALTDIPGGLSGGTITLVLEYRTAIGDQFQSMPVDTLPDNAAGYIFRTSEKNGVNALPQGVPVELVFDLTLLQLPVQATDVEINIIYTKADGTPAIGVNNISEPTPVDVYNNTDYTCLNGTWYRYDDPAAMAIVDSNNDGIADLGDIYPHTINNISFLSGSAEAVILDASASSTLLAPGPLATGQMLRLGYMLTDYANRYAFNEIRTGQNGDPWPHAAVNNKIYTGTGFRNDATAWSSMFTFRNADTKMWWGTSVIFVNKEYPLGSSCTWDALNQKLGL